MSEVFKIDPALHEEIKKRLSELGILDRSYYVGGAVRDSLLGIPASDVDIVLEKPTEEDLSKLSEKLELVGKGFPVFLMKIGNETFELAVARKERKTGKGYMGFTVYTSPDITIRDDLIRRDLTMNAMAVPVKDISRLVDPFNGKKDLERGIIRHVSEAFAEDPLRVFRAARFASQFGFRVHPKTIELMKRLKDELKYLAPERIQMETDKAFKKSERPSVYFRVLLEADALGEWFPEIERMIGIPQPPQYHPEGDVFEHTMIAIDNAKILLSSELVEFGPKETLNIMWSVLFHDVGKILTPPEEWPSHHEHERRGLELVDELSKRYRFTRRRKTVVSDAIAYHMVYRFLSEMKPKTIIKKLEPLFKRKTLKIVAVVNAVDSCMLLNATPDQRLIRMAEQLRKILPVIEAVRETFETKMPEDVAKKLRDPNRSVESKKAIRFEYYISLFKRKMSELKASADCESEYDLDDSLVLEVPR